MKKNGKFVKRPNQQLSRLYRGKRRFNAKFIRYTAKHLSWALDLKPGDYVATCEGCNRQVKEIQISWSNTGDFNKNWHKKNTKESRQTQHWFINEITVIDTHGNSHGVGYCCYPKETRQQVIDFFKECYLQDVEADEFGEVFNLPTSK